MGRWLLTELERAGGARHLRSTPRALRQPAGDGGASHGGLAAALQHRAEAPTRFGAFVLCMPLAESGCFLVVSTQVGR